jgi:hypothetical protein
MAPWNSQALTSTQADIWRLAGISLLPGSDGTETLSEAIYDQELTYYLSFLTQQRYTIRNLPAKRTPCPL